VSPKTQQGNTQTPFIPAKTPLKDHQKEVEEAHEEVNAAPRSAINFMPYVAVAQEGHNQIPLDSTQTLLPLVTPAVCYLQLTPRKTGLLDIFKQLALAQGPTCPSTTAQSRGMSIQGCRFTYIVCIPGIPLVPRPLQ
jgi:hypothetical protein